jgi:hypothetical protein
MSASPEARSYLPPEEPPFRVCSMAAISLFMGIMGWVALPFISAIIAILLGHMARLKIARSEGTLTGDPLAVAGLWLGYLNIAFVALMGVCGLGLFLWIALLNVSAQ